MNTSPCSPDRALPAPARLVRLTWLVAALAAVSSAFAAPTVVQDWEFGQASGTSLSASTNTIAGGAAWSGTLTGVTQNGSSALRFGYNSTTLAYRYATLGSNSGGIYTTTAIFSDWRLFNGANSGTTRPTFYLGFRSAASSSSSLVADISLVARSGGVELAVRDSASTFVHATLPSQLPGALTVTLTVDKNVTPNTYTLAYAVVGGASGTVNGTLGTTSSGRAISHLSLSVAGNFTNSGTNTPHLLVRLQVAYETTT
ncbi:MAG: hypothetical protein H7067_10415, partial [Burkholderiales bacterium]|nr:hypothetical protein [Opitutaceae bacterium]